MVEWTWLASFGEPVPAPALSAANMSACIGDWPFCDAVAASGGVVRECGEMVEGGAAAEKPGKVAGGIFRTSDGDGSQGWPSPFILAATEAAPSPSGSGEAFLFMVLGCFPLSVGGEGVG